MNIHCDKNYCKRKVKKFLLNKNISFKLSLDGEKNENLSTNPKVIVLGFLL